MDSSTEFKQISNTADALNEMASVANNMSSAIAIGAAIGAVIKDALPVSELERIAELANAFEVDQLKVNSFTLDDSGETQQLITNWSELPVEPKPDKSAGFVYIGNDTWLPKALFYARKRQQRKGARKDQNSVVWTR